MVKEEIDLSEWKKTSKKYGSMHGEIKLRKYCTKLNSNNSLLILKARIGMIEAKANFKNMHADTKCGRCGEEETTEHLVKCYIMDPTEQDKNTMQKFSYHIQNIDKITLSTQKSINVIGSLSQI